MADIWQCAYCRMPNEPTTAMCVECGNPAYPLYPSILVPLGPQPYADPADEAARRRRQMYTALLTVILLLLVASAATAVVLRLRNDSTTPSAGLSVTLPSAGAPSRVSLDPTAVATAVLPATFPSATDAGTPGLAGMPGDSVAPTAVPTVSSAPTASTMPSAIGIVDVSAIATAPAAPAVGDVFWRYFSGINTKNYAQALAALDPSGSINTTNPTQVSMFIRGESTTSDSTIAVHSVAPDATRGGALDVRVTFNSRQAAGYGPPGNTKQTCTAWNISYVLTPYGDTYRIFGPGASSYSGC